jgi:MFS family permease
MPADMTAVPAGLGRNSNWKRLWLGQAISMTGDYVFNITVMLWITVRIAKGLHWAPAAGAGAVIAAAVPALVVGPFAGVFVDRWNRRRTMLVADASRAVLIAALHRGSPFSAWSSLLTTGLRRAGCFRRPAASPPSLARRSPRRCCSSRVSSGRC